VPIRPAAPVSRTGPPPCPLTAAAR
jgi:hypothetical protein